MGKILIKLKQMIWHNNDFFKDIFALKIKAWSKKPQHVPYCIRLLNFVQYSYLFIHCFSPEGT